MPRLTANRVRWILILALAVALRLVAGVWWQSRLPPDALFYFGDSDSYWQLGKAIAHGEPYQYVNSDQRVLRTPGYPLLLAGLLRIFGDGAPVLAARALSAVLGTMAVAVVGWWTTQLFDARAGLWAGCIAALYPGAVSMGAFVLSEAPFCPFMLLELALWGLAWRAANNRAAVPLALAGGVAGGIATLMRPSWLLFTPLAIVVGLAMDSRRGRQLLVGAALCGGLAACMLPWWIRNARLTGHFVATTLQVGASLYDGLNPAADGGSNMAFAPDFAAQEHVNDGAGADEEPFEYRLDRRLGLAAIDWSVANPARVAHLVWIKLVRTWSLWPNEPSLRSWPLRLMIALTYAPLLGLGLLGAWRFSSWGWPYVLAWLPAVYLLLLHVTFVSSIRYREPAMLALTVLAAGVLTGGTRGPAEAAGSRGPSAGP